VSHLTGVTPRRLKNVTMFMAESNVGHKVCRPGDLVINTLWAWMAAIGVTRNSGIVSPAYGVYRPVEGGGVLPSDADYLLRTPVYAAEYQRRSTGVNSSRLRLYPEQFLRMPALLPPAEDQTAIVRFLDHANGRLERAIRAKRKVVALLVEQKQAVVQRAVARGFDPHVRCRPSGDAGLGEVPEHWTAWRISRFARVGNGSTPSRTKPSYWNGGTYPWLNSSHVNRDIIDSADQFITRAALRECHLPRVRAGSVLVAITGQGKKRGKAAPLAIEATINQHIAYITPRLHIVSTEYLHLALTAAYRQLRAISDDAGSTKGALTCEDLKRFKIAVPPLQEQEGLIQRVRAETSELTAAAARLDREIELLREYRTRLVSDVVTGQLDVREAAMRLPAEVPTDLEAEPGDETDDNELTDEEAAEA
jgi:type I restriction enzyme, S subunit